MAKFHTKAQVLGPEVLKKKGVMDFNFNDEDLNSVLIKTGSLIIPDCKDMSPKLNIQHLYTVIKMARVGSKR